MLSKRKPLQEVTPTLALDILTSELDISVEAYMRANAELTMAVEGLRANLEILQTGNADPAQQPALFELEGEEYNGKDF